MTYEHQMKQIHNAQPNSKAEVHNITKQNRVIWAFDKHNIIEHNYKYNVFSAS